MTAAARPPDVSRSRIRSSGSGCGSGSSSKTAGTRKPPPSVARRRLPNRIWSLVTLALVMYQLQQFAHSGGGGGGVSAAPTPGSLASSNTTLKHLQKRSGVNFRATFQHLLNASSTHLDWGNTCNHRPTGLSEKHNKTRRCRKRLMILQKLQKQAARELRGVQGDDKDRHTVDNMNRLANKSIKALDIRKIRKYKLHRVHYKLLPRLNNSSNQLNLRHVHRDLQHFVGAFTYLRNAKMHWDLVNLQARSVLADELGRLRKSARDMLCSVEDAINLTNLLYTPARQRVRGQGASPKKRRQAQPAVTFRIQSRPVMENWLQLFRSKPVELHQQATLAARGVDVPPPPDSPNLKLDALFAKYEFVQYLKSIRVILSHQRRDLCKARSTMTSTKGQSQAQAQSQMQS
ncbi:uncharacterized protein LOC108032949 [Drosophila biarmipes]|uniref:uncharacterized protein LOC108032949 n=1 Tax=Drosophila biarmipes TaxID=125945 RepID=UPI001CDB01E7|nr:uncharacterized protein LOC108032949 [Drosophila biarmipes]